MNNYLYCKLFVNYDKDNFDDIVANILEFSLTTFPIKHKLVTAFIHRNKDVTMKEKMQPSPEDEFLFYPHYIELESTYFAEEKPYIELVSNLVLSLRKQCGDVVAACDFADQLP